MNSHSACVQVHKVSTCELNLAVLSFELCISLYVELEAQCE